MIELTLQMILVLIFAVFIMVGAFKMNKKAGIIIGMVFLLLILANKFLGVFLANKFLGVF